MPTSVFSNNKKEKKEGLVAAAVAVARGSKNGRKGAVFIQAEKESDDNRQSATTQHVRAATVLTENKQSDKNPKGSITLGATIHKKPPVSYRRICIRLFPFLLA